MDIFALKCFMKLAEYHNFTKAAFQLHVSQPTLSRIIAGLESEVCVKLFNRGKYDITLSEAGEEFLKHSKRIVAEYEEAIRYTQAVGNGQKGCVRIGFLPALSMSILPKLVEKMEKEYPKFELILQPYSQAELIRELKNETIDLAIIIDWETDRLAGFESEPVMHDDYCVALHKDHVLAQRETLTLDDVHKEKCLFYKKTADAIARDMIGTGIIASQFGTELNVVFENKESVNDILALLTLIECKVGIGILPSHMNVVNFPNIKFTKLLLGEECRDFGFRGIACYKKNADNSGLEVVLDILKENIRKQS